MIEAKSSSLNEPLLLLVQNNIWPSTINHVCSIITLEKPFIHVLTLISASLLHAYDTSWQVESFPSLIGKSNNANNEEKTSAQR